MRTRAHLTYSIVGGPFYEPVANYQPKREPFIEFIESILPEDWRVKHSGVWFHCMPVGTTHARHAWKIHVSANPTTAEDVLNKAATTLIRHGVPFKCVADMKLLRFQVSKSWTRGGSGKFVTAYPKDEDTFRVVIEALHQATQGISGPYVLSDRRYRDSQCVFYRYGTVRPIEKLNAAGRSVPIIDGPDGTSTDDERLPYYVQPDWVKDPFGYVETQDDEPGNTLNKGRYRVLRAITFSNSGGVYEAEDTQIGEHVLIKEARPYVSCSPSGVDAIGTLRKECRLLRKLEHLEVAPRVKDYFVDWEHEYLVEEYLQGSTLSELGARTSILLRTRITDSERQESYNRDRSLLIATCEAVSKIHSEGIVLSDLSPNNVFVLDGDLGVKLIDFEAAREIGIDRSTGIATMGFRSAESNTEAKEDAHGVALDYYPLAALAVGNLFHVSPFFELSRESTNDIVHSLCEDARFPKGVEDALIIGLSPTASNLMSPSSLASVLRSEPTIRKCEEHTPYVSTCELENVRSGITDYILAKMTPGRSDRLFPSDFRLYETNPINLSCGALGILASLHRLGVPIPGIAMDWVTQRLELAKGYTPGLGVGQAGIAWCLLELNQLQTACDLLRESRNNPLLDNCGAGIMYGLAGWGLANLKAFALTQDEQFLDAARYAAEQLMSASVTDESNRRYWPHGGSAKDAIDFGFMHGATGVSVFFLYLSKMSGESAYIQFGESALYYDIAQAHITRDGGLSWPYRSDIHNIVSPYLEYGSAGVAMAVARYAHACDSSPFEDTFNKLLIDLDRKYTVLPVKYNGMAGIAGANLDCYLFTGKAAFMRAAYRNVEGLLLYRISQEGGTAFPGSVQHKISCDYGYGSAGIAVLLDRICNLTSPEFLLDEHVFPEIYRDPIARGQDLSGLPA